MVRCGNGDIHRARRKAQWRIGRPRIPLQIAHLDLTIIRRAILALLLALWPADAARAGAWVLPEGERQVTLQSALVAATSEFGPESRLYDSRPYSKLEVTLQFEFGLSDWLTLIAAPQYLDIYFSAPGPSSYSGPGYVDLGARARLYQQNELVVSAQTTARIPGTGGAPSAAAVGYEDPEFDLRLLAGTAFTLWGRHAFLDMQVAQRLRFGDPPDELHADVTFGVRTTPRVQMLLQSFNVISEGAGEGPYFGVSYEYYKFQVGVMYDWSAEVVLGAAAVSTWLARNAPQENGLTLSARYRF